MGWIFAQSNKERDFILSVEEVCQIAAVQDEFGQEAVTGVVSMSPEGDVHFEAFQVRTFSTIAGAYCTTATFVSDRESVDASQLQELTRNEDEMRCPNSQLKSGIPRFCRSLMNEGSSGTRPGLSQLARSQGEA